ncbi:MAG: cation transporter [Ignavibacteriae bacterium]|nr:cation transporter [Ignavibacteriota bacterium]
MKETKLTTIGSVVTAIFASLCCIGPAVLAIIGASGISLFSAFVKYRPYFIGFTVILLGLAFYFTYRKREVVCEDGSCKIQSAGKWNKITVWLATLIAVGALAFPYVDGVSTAEVNTSITPGATAVLDIKGMDCKACARGIEGMLAQIEGVRQAKVDFDKERGEVLYDPNRVTPNTFVERINETSYTASLVSNEPVQSTKQ